MKCTFEMVQAHRYKFGNQGNHPFTFSSQADLDNVQQPTGESAGSAMKGQDEASCNGGPIL